MKLAVKTAFAVGFSYLTARGVIVSLHHDHSARWLPSIIFVGVFVFSIWEITWSKESLASLEDVIAALVVSKNTAAVRRWYRRVVEKMYHKGFSLLTALVAIPLCIFLWNVSGWNAWIRDTVLRRYDTVSEILMLSAAASSQWPFVNISRFVMRLPRKNLSINFYAHPRDSIMSLGSLLMKIDLGGVLLTSLLAIALYVSPIRIPITVYLILICVFLWAGVWFFVTQYAIHQCMLEEKRRDLKLVSERLMAMLQLVRSDPNPTNQKLFEDSKRLYDQLEALPEWPFHKPTVLALASGIFVPILVTVANIVLKH